MPPTPKRWEIAPIAPRWQRQRLLHLHPLLVQVLYNRGVTDPEDVDAFLVGRARFDDPFCCGFGLTLLQCLSNIR